MDTQIIVAYDEAMSVRGAPGLFFPNDKARIDYLWTHRNDLRGELSFDGDVDGAVVEDTLGNRFITLTVNGLDDIQTRLDAIEIKLDELGNVTDQAEQLSEIRSDFDALSNAVDELADEQKTYFKGAQFDTVSGALSFVDGWGFTSFSLAGATAEPYTPSESASESGSETGTQP